MASLMVSLKKAVQEQETKDNNLPEKMNNLNDGKEERMFGKKDLTFKVRIPATP